MNPLIRVLALAGALAAGACATLSQEQRDAATRIAVEAQPVVVDCMADDACATTSALRELGTQAVAASTPDAPRHHALILDYGQDALLARLSLIRSAQRTLDVQTYIFDEDDAGHLFLDEMLAAARRGVRVRVLVDQLSALRRVETLAALAGAHANFEMRIYNPVLGRARISYPQYVLAAACCWRRLNQRMHSKLLLVDGMVGITGGRNYQNSYYDWDPVYNFRDRDLFVAGPVVADMAANFEQYWVARLTRTLPGLSDVGRALLRGGVPSLPHAPFDLPDRVQRISRDADDQGLVAELAAYALPVAGVGFIADPPQKHRRNYEGVAPSTRGLRELIDGAKEEVLLQTPYLVLSPPAQAQFRELRLRDAPPRVVVSTNSLAATDAFITYALSYKYKRRFLREFGFEIHEFKPFPQDAPIDVEATGTVDIAWDANGNAVVGGRRGRAAGVDGSQGGGGRATRPLAREYSALRWSGFSAHEPVPLERGGVRFGLHAKSLVIDERIGVVGTHNFDPRGDTYNTESAVVIEEPAFARTLAASIRRDMLPANAWTIAPRDKPPVFSGLDYSLGKVSEALPVFDLWPIRYATSYEFRPSPACPQPIPPSDPRFRECYDPVGDFPGVQMGLKTLMTRIFTAFGAGLAPIL
ncbi:MULTISPECIES: phospholipase D family protein [unclassified Luteimonas]|uniref:phospholipase D family protein n=1 Tax=unclassified Luteimonas TaxID=2629088 RepID=UPI0018F08B07|nr:phospholipase D family protein [Luteimonas sp. MC1572]MBJ6982042.1 phospholipase D family protein [Luteimonas sp. MC1572]MBJ7575379.1 phospholipase D family protein [Luteimonas sp. MC1828]QQO03340.1 phospholipase D family protein [Luteimonas sp. MC1572]